MTAPDLSTRVIENTRLRLEYLTGAGPRLLRLTLQGSNRNLFAEIPQVTFESPHGPYHPYGGHRLWLSPENPGITYFPDDFSPRADQLPDGVRLTGPVETPSGVQKSMEVRFDAGQSVVTLNHTLTNLGSAEVEFAPWAITQMAPGGWAVIPNVPPQTASKLLPDRSLALWPYTRLDDSRLRFMDDLILVRSDETVQPCKIGLRSQDGWLGYYHAGVFFRKLAQPDWSQPYPDFGCNLEVYVDNRFLELETIGPLTRLSPGASLSHRETWQIWAGLDVADTAEAAAALARELK
jgi:hypothetical protein